MRKHSVIMTENNVIFYGKCLSASMILVGLCLFPNTVQVAHASIHAKTLPVQNRSQWTAAAQHAISTFGELNDSEVVTAEHESLHGFVLTAYTLDKASTGKSPTSPAFGITASGTHAKVGRTVAVDPNVIPIGSLLYIPGIGWRIAEDSGGAVKGRHVDILLPTRHDAVEFGVRHPQVIYLYE